MDMEGTHVVTMKPAALNWYGISLYYVGGYCRCSKTKLACNQKAAFRLNRLRRVHLNKTIEFDRFEPNSDRTGFVRVFILSISII